jgi:hypothetical protein
VTISLRFAQFWLLLLVVSIFNPLPLRAGTDWVQINPAELQVKDLPEQPGAPAFVLFREEVDDDQMHFHSEYMRIKVLTEAGRKYADVQIPYFRGAFSVSDVHGRTIHADGSIVELQGKPYDKVVMKSKSNQATAEGLYAPGCAGGKHPGVQIHASL